MKNLSQIVVLPRQVAEKLRADVPYIFVSICDPTYAIVEPLTPPVDSVRLEFVDWDTTKNDPEDLNREWFGKRIGDCLIQPADAKALADFLVKNADAESIVIHCLAGISRSVSTAQAIVDALRLSRGVINIYSGRSNFGTPPNQMVYSAMYAAVREAFFPETKCGTTDNSPRL